MIFDGLEAIITVVFEFLTKPAFDKNKSLIKRLPFFILFIIIQIILIIICTTLTIIFFKNKSTLFGIISLIISITLLVGFILTFIKSRN